MRGSPTVVHLSDAITRHAKLNYELLVCLFQREAQVGCSSVAPFITYIPEKKLLNADWLRQTAFFSLPLWYQESIITDPNWLKLASQRSVLLEIR